MIGRSAKSHQYYYYTCNGGFKKGKETCDARALPKDKFERLVIEQVRERVLNQESLEELVGLVNQELDSGNDILKEKLDAATAELTDVQTRLSKLYDALETNKLSLDDLAPRIKDLRLRHEELTRARLQLQLDQGTSKARHLNARMVKAYAEDLRRLLDEARVPESKAFLRSFIKRIEIDGGSARVHYIVPVPPDGRRESLWEFCLWSTLVGKGGLEPPRLSAHDPKSCSSANSDTSPHRKPLNTIAFCRARLKLSPSLPI
jgi:site-specific DNA recombinase